MATAMAVMGQVGKTEKPMALDPVTQGRVYMAYRDARAWSYDQANKLCHWHPIIRLRMDLRQSSQAKYDYTRHQLEVGAAKQIREAYGISHKTLIAVISDPRSQVLDFIPEPMEEDKKGGIVITSNSKRWTRFDPGKVVLPETIAKKIGYKNPDPNAPSSPPPFHVNSYTNDGRLIPGRPRDPEVERRKLEIEERAAGTVIKDPVPGTP